MLVALPPVPPIVAPDAAPGTHGPVSIVKGRYWCLTLKKPSRKPRSLGCMFVPTSLSAP